MMFGILVATLTFIVAVPAVAAGTSPGTSPGASGNISPNKNNSNKEKPGTSSGSKENPKPVNPSTGYTDLIAVPLAFSLLSGTSAVVILKKVNAKEQTSIKSKKSGQLLVAMLMIISSAIGVSMVFPFLKNVCK